MAPQGCTTLGKVAMGLQVYKFKHPETKTVSKLLLEVIGASNLQLKLIHHEIKTTTAHTHTHTHTHTAH